MSRKDYIMYSLSKAYTHFWLSWHSKKPVYETARFYRSHVKDVEPSIGIRFLSRVLTSIMEVQSIPGDIIECGTYKGGCALLIAHFLESIKSLKHVYACDTFEGHPYDDRFAGVHKKGDFGDTSVSYVRDKFRRFKVSERITIIKGRFEDAFPKKLQDKVFSLALLDCDLYDSTKFCLSFLYPRMAHKGLMFFHDYNPECGMKVAVDEFLKTKKLILRKGSAHYIQIL